MSLEWSELAAAPGTHSRVLELLNRHVKSLRGAHVLDMPFGASLVSKWMQPQGLEIAEITINQLSGKTCFTELTRRYFTHKLPTEMKGEVPHYGDVIIYVLKKP